MKIHVDYETYTHIGMVKDLDEKIRAFFESIGCKHTGSGSGMGKRDLEFEMENEDVRSTPKSAGQE